MLLVYVWCDKININGNNGKNGTEIAPICKNIYFHVLTQCVVLEFSWNPTNLTSKSKAAGHIG
jgi:hypothetical protein